MSAVASTATVKHYLTVAEPVSGSGVKQSLTTEDREAAAEILGMYESMGARARALKGDLDMHPVVEAFAAHRIAAQRDLLAAVKQLRKFICDAPTLDYNEDRTLSGIAVYGAYLDGLIARAHSPNN